MSRNPQLYIHDIIKSCQRIMLYVEEYDYNKFCQDEKTYDAVIRNIEIIGEATKNLPVEIKTSYPNIEWKKIAGLRDIVVHAYFGIDNIILWDIIESKIPALLKELLYDLHDKQDIQ